MERPEDISHKPSFVRSVMWKCTPNPDHILYSKDTPCTDNYDPSRIFQIVFRLANVQ